MSGNCIGKLFTVTTAGESHGIANIAIVDGCPPGMALSEVDIQCELDRRRPGLSRVTSQRREGDIVKILSGVFKGQTTGTSIGLYVENCDARERDYTELEAVFRPSHADIAYQRKYGIRDHRGGGRASARETVMRVAAGAIAKKYLREQFNIFIRACLIQVGLLKLSVKDWDSVAQNPFYCADPEKVSELMTLIQNLQRQGDSIGSQVFVEAINVPAGLGEPVFDRLDADLAHAFMGIPAVKGVALGEGFNAVLLKGSENRDEITPQGFLSNHAGGVLGGISTGQTIQAHLAFKPASSIRIPGRSINLQGETVSVSTKGRHDPCVGIRAVPVVEAMMAIVLMDHVLRQRGQNTVVSKGNFCNND